MTQTPKFDGGSDADRKRLLEVHREYLAANGVMDTSALRKHWRNDIIGFNLNGHTYVGLEEWTKLWDYYRTQIVADEPWTSHDVTGIIRGDMAVITCQRSVKLRWIGGDPAGSFADRRLGSRSTEVFVRENGDWKVAHVHFSPAGDGPRPGNF